MVNVINRLPISRPLQIVQDKDQLDNFADLIVVSVSPLPTPLPRVLARFSEQTVLTIQLVGVACPDGSVTANLGFPFDPGDGVVLCFDRKLRTKAILIRGIRVRYERRARRPPLLIVIAHRYPRRSN